MQNGECEHKLKLRSREGIEISTENKNVYFTEIGL